MTLVQHRSISGVVMVAAIALAGLLIWRNRRKVTVGSVIQAVGNPAAPWSNTPAAPNPSNPPSTSWTENGLSSDNTSDVQSIYGD
jgi:hypothetical protein